MRGKLMTLMMKQRFQALLYIVAILAAIQITGCRSNSMSGGGGATGGILPPSSVAAQITTAAEAGFN
jgi:predicted small secreted protein